MKKTFLICFVLLSFNLVAQVAQLNDGFYVTNNNDTITCKIKTHRAMVGKGIDVMELVCDISVVENGVNKRFNAREIKSFTVYDIKDKKYKFASYKGEDCFVRILEEGHISIGYVYSFNPINLSFSTITTLIKNEKVYRLNISNRKQIIGELIADFPELQKEWLFGKNYKSNDIERLIKDYNVYMKNNSLSTTKSVSLDSLKTNMSESNKKYTLSADTIDTKLDEFISDTQFRKLFANKPYALKEINTSIFQRKTSMVLANVGGYLFGFTLVLGLTNLDSVDYSWGLALGVTAGIAGLGFIINSSSKSHRNKAIEIYNSNRRNTVDLQKNYLKIGFTNSGVGLTYCF
jgi:hypothetical protein